MALHCKVYSFGFWTIFAWTSTTALILDLHMNYVYAIFVKNWRNGRIDGFGHEICWMIRASIMTLAISRPVSSGERQWALKRWRSPLGRCLYRIKFIENEPKGADRNFSLRDKPMDALLGEHIDTHWARSAINMAIRPRCRSRHWNPGNFFWITRQAMLVCNSAIIPA